MNLKYMYIYKTSIGKGEMIEVKDYHALPGTMVNPEHQIQFWLCSQQPGKLFIQRAVFYYNLTQTDRFYHRRLPFDKIGCVPL